eukprot:GFUD01037329.1.p1 GENE.GFUD01037329.1~~GFUD01037329.1.p1  ORF type:complete len:144 (+),score=0.83 GFUD01037329.1:911-1342(+)
MTHLIVAVSFVYTKRKPRSLNIRNKFKMFSSSPSLSLSINTKQNTKFGFNQPPSNTQHKPGLCGTRFCYSGLGPGLQGSESRLRDGTETRKYSVPFLGPRPGLYFFQSQVRDETGTKKSAVSFSGLGPGLDINPKFAMGPRPS